MTWPAISTGNSVLPIPENILTKEPSSELRPNQKDSDILPPYEVVDAILYRLIEDGQSP